MLISKKKKEEKMPFRVYLTEVLTVIFSTNDYVVFILNIFLKLVFLNIIINK